MHLTPEPNNMQGAASANTPADSDAFSPIPKNEDNSAGRDEEDDELDSGSEEVDDPNDKTFSAASRRKAAGPKLVAVRGRKRKLTSNGPRVKRARVSAEGNKDDGPKDADGSTDCAPVIVQHPRERQVAGFMSTKMPIPMPGEPFGN